MPLSTRQKHDKGVRLVSNYLKLQGVEHTILKTDPTFDIQLSDSNKCIKIFCNSARAKNIKVPSGFIPSEGILYLVVSPTAKNKIGFSSVGGLAEDVEKALVSFPSPNAPKNILTDKLGIPRIKHFISVH